MDVNKRNSEHINDIVDFIILHLHLLFCSHSLMNNIVYNFIIHFFQLLCHRVYIILRLCGLKVGELHSKLPQSARLRNLALFAKGEQRVLLATDLAARGLDIQGVETVINFKLNASYEMYVHRVGRTARAGNRGLAVSLVADREYNTLKLFKKQTKTPMYKRIVDKG